MEPLKAQELKTMKEIFKLTQPQLLNLIYKFLKSKYKKVYYKKGEYVLAVGAIPVGLLAHADTVFERPPEDIYYDREQNVMFSPQGLGADDRAGILSIINLVRKGYRPTIVITTDEELGAVGANKLVKDFPKAPAALKYLIQLDRRGSSDCVFYDCDNKHFTQYIEAFGFITAGGTFTDISFIAPAWKVAAVNLSIGYMNEHSKIETLNVGWMKATELKVAQMIDAADEAPVFEYIESPHAYSWCDSFKEAIHKCHKCQQADLEYNMYPVQSTKGERQWYCLNCLDDNKIGWCWSCGEPYVLTPGDEKKPVEKQKCYKCKERKDI